MKKQCYSEPYTDVIPTKTTADKISMLSKSDLRYCYFKIPVIQLMISLQHLCLEVWITSMISLVDKNVFDSLTLHRRREDPALCLDPEPLENIEIKCYYHRITNLVINTSTTY